MSPVEKQTTWRRGSLRENLIEILTKFKVRDNGLESIGSTTLGVSFEERV